MTIKILTEKEFNPPIIEEEKVKKTRKPYKKRASQLRKNICDKYNDFLHLINLAGDYMMFQQHFIYLAETLGYATTAQLQNDILPDMKRMGLVKTQFVGGSGAVMLLLRRTSIRHIKGLETSQEASSRKESSSDFSKILNIMKMDYFIETVITDIQRLNKDDESFKLTIEGIKDFLNEAGSTLLLKQADELAYYKKLIKTPLADTVEKKDALNEVKRFSLYNSARQKIHLNKNVELSEMEIKALDYHENYFVKYHQSETDKTYYETIALIKRPQNTDYNFQGGEKHKDKKNQLNPNKLRELERLSTDPRLIITHLRKQNIFVERLLEDKLLLVMFSTKKSLSQAYIKALLESLYMTFIILYGPSFKMTLTIYFFNESQVLAFNRQWEKTKKNLTNLHNVNGLEIKAISMDIADEYLVFSSN